MKRKEKEREPSLVPARTPPLCAARYKGEIISAGRVISRQSRRLSLAYQSRMFLSSFSLFPSPSSLPPPPPPPLPPLVPLPVSRATPRRSPRLYLVSRGPSAPTRLWRRGKYVRTPIGAISISPDSNLGSLERGECASFAVHSARGTCRRKRDKKERDGGRRTRFAREERGGGLVSRDAPREKGRKGKGEGEKGDGRRMESKW